MSGCLALMVAVAYEGRALPLAWTVVRGKKGHFPQNAHVQLAQQVQSLIPKGREVVFLGYGEFDGVELLGCIEKFGWKYACRTAKNTLVYSEIDVSSGATGTPIRDHVEDFGLKPGQGINYQALFFTGKKYGPIQTGAAWESGHDEPIYLVTNFPHLEQAHEWYKKRFQIETFFSDQKSRGFHICHSHLSDPPRLSRLLIASCLAYYWIVCLGCQVLRQGGHRLIHRTDRCDWSLFRLGLAWLEHCFNEGWRVEVFFANQESQAGKILCTVVNFSLDTSTVVVIRNSPPPL